MIKCNKGFGHTWENVIIFRRSLLKYSVFRYYDMGNLLSSGLKGKKKHMCMCGGQMGQNINNLSF